MSRQALSLAIGAGVRHRRLAKNLTAGQLAQRCKLSETYLLGIEQGDADANISALDSIATGLGVSVANLLDAIPKLSREAREVARLFMKLDRQTQKAAKLLIHKLAPSEEPWAT